MIGNRRRRILGCNDIHSGLAMPRANRRER
jgi:hypothetical protein